MLNLVDKVFDTDVLVVGSEGAGGEAAVHAKMVDPNLRVTIATKGRMGKCGATITCYYGDWDCDSRSIHELHPDRRNRIRRRIRLPRKTHGSREERRKSQQVHKPKENHLRGYIGLQMHSHIKSLPMIWSTFLLTIKIYFGELLMRNMGLISESILEAY